MHLTEPRKSHIYQFCHIFNACIIPFIVFIFLLLYQFSAKELQVLHEKVTRILTYIIREDISSCFNSNNVWVVIEDFESYRTVILVCKRHKMTTTKFITKFWPLMFNECQSINLPSAFLWKFSFTSSLACRGYKIRMEF